MGSLSRGLLGIGVYLGLVLGPLLAAALAPAPPVGRPFAVELGVAAGFVAFGLLSVELALVARLRAASDPFGTDVLMLVHRWMGLAALGFVAAHPLPFWGRGVGARSFVLPGRSAVEASGAVALWALVLLIGLALLRRRLSLSYEAWRVAHLALAVVVVAASLVHVRAIGGAVRAPLAWAVVHGWAAVFLALFVHYRLARPLLRWRRPWEVVANRDEGGDTRTLVLRPLGHRGLAFEPGQFVWLATGRTPLALDDHPISISSSAVLGADRSLELSIKALGDWSRERVPRLAPGHRVWLDGPFGAFTPDRVPAQGFVLIAGGIGITPLRSMLLTLRDRGDPRPVLLVHAAHDASRAVFAAELRRLEREMPLTLVPVREAPAPGEAAERGFVTAELLRRHLPADAGLRAFFVCGPGPMMDALEGTLAELGVPQERVRTERFDMV